ncbi:TraR/DksA family transcriptional regulator [Streptomyces macrosporus]|uniref:TraR/DksA family transcriptional regulator n=1 Tax=Streptomyces macrosporus TaxID=44032 RepID=A0ABN3JYH0_9ACTN
MRKPAAPATEAADGVRRRTADVTGAEPKANPRGAGRETSAGTAPAADEDATAGRTAPGADGRDVATETAAGAAGEETGAKTVVAKKTTTGAPAAEVPTARAAATPAAPDELVVRPGESPWTPDEVEEARAELSEDAARLRTEIHAAEEALNGLMRDSADATGDDQADTGTKNITREHEMALAENAREMLYQTERALGRLEAGTYGVCESCGRPIGKARMQAFPRATLCVECKQRQERR